MSHELRVESPKPDVTVAASRSASGVRLDASYLPASEGKAASAAVAAVQTAFPQEGCVGAANARWVKGFVVAAQAHSGWAQAGYSAVPMAGDSIPYYLALAGPSELRCSLDVWRAWWPLAEPR